MQASAAGCAVSMLRVASGPTPAHSLLLVARDMTACREGPAVLKVPSIEVGTFAAIESVREDISLDTTTCEALIDARLGQGKFRQDLIERFGGACAVTGCGFLPLLRASHIKPWRESTHAERLDPDNGLLLTANLDALFDRALISFSDEGAVILSRQLPREVLAHLGPMEKLPLALSPEQRKYLAHHRAGLEPKSG